MENLKGELIDFFFLQTIVVFGGIFDGYFIEMNDNFVDTFVEIKLIEDIWNWGNWTIKN